METEHNLIVQEVLEKTAPWLNEVKRLKLLSDNETNTIVKTRTDFEYKLLATRRTKDLYLRYIQYELNLLGMIKTRMKERGLHLLNHHLDSLKHIETIFKRAISLDLKDVSMWKTFIDFCVRYNYHVENALEAAVRANPMNPDVWILGAKWQIEVNQSKESARYLFQRAVKLNQESEKLWLEFFKLESVLARAEATDTDGIENEKENGLNSKYNDEKAQFTLYAIPMLIYKQATAATTLKDNYQLRFQMFKILSYLEFTNHLQNFILQDIMLNFRDNEECIVSCITIELNNYIEQYQSFKSKKNKKGNKDNGLINQNFGNRTKFYESGVKALDSIAEVLKAIPTQKMWLLYSRLCLQLFYLFVEIEELERESKQLDHANQKDKVTKEGHGECSSYFWRRLFNEIYRDANNKGLMCEEMLHDYCNLLKNCSTQQSVLLKTLERACCQLYPYSSDLWILYISISNGEKSVIDKAISKYIARPVIPKESKEYTQEAEKQVKFWKYVLQFVKNWAKSMRMKELDHYFLQAIKYCSHSHEMKKLYFKFYTKIYPFEGDTENIQQKNKFEKLDQVLQVLLSLPPNSADIYRILIAYFTSYLKKKEDDENVSSSKDDFDVQGKSEQILMKLYSRAITDHGRDEEDFWLHYIVMMKRKGNFQKAQNLHYQATKTLRDSNKVQSFLEKYDLLK